MPRVKTTHGRLKAISCPRCGKKFCTAMNVLQHMNLPTGSCFDTVPLLNDSLNNLAQGIAADFSEASHSHTTGQPLQEERKPPWSPGLYWDVEMSDTALNTPNDPAVQPSQPNCQHLPGRFMETFEGCGENFPGGKTFMDDFWADQYADQRRENIYYPWASKQEWAFVSWLLRSRLSMAAETTNTH
jgi:hypothetical protein